MAGPSTKLQKNGGTMNDSQWTILEKLKRHNGKRNRTYLKCRCSCGAIKEILEQNVKNGNSTNCGHIPRKVKSHKKCGTSEYYTWCSMKNRCFDKGSKVYKYYGGRGVTVCDRWIKSFENFLSDMGPRPEGMTLDRINNNGNYEPSNCRWASRSVQQFNKRTAGFVKVKNGFSARIKIAGKINYLGTFKTETEARQAYNKAKEKALKELV